VPFESFERLLVAFGFEHRRTRGSHHIYWHPRANRPLSIQSKGGEAKPYQIAQFMAIVEEFGLRMENDE
jgi:predicted RNA binding protein YcfA (HicA-like mRNA interferase family)